MSFDAVRKIIVDVNRGCRILLDLFYRQPIYIDDCVEYNYMELKCDNDVRIFFFIYSEFSTKGSIELNTTFRRFPNEILVLMQKPRKPITVVEIITLMRNKSV